MTGSHPTHPPGHPISRLKSAPAEPFTGYRRIMGLVLGALLGFTYGLVSQMINRLALPGVPLFQPPLGPAGNILLCAVDQHARGEPPLTRAHIPLALVLVMVFVAAFELMDGSAQDQVAPHAADGGSRACRRCGQSARAAAWPARP